MESLSRPYQIALVVMLAFGALYFVALKPSDEEEPLPPPPAVVAAPATTATTPKAPGVDGLSTAVDKAKGAAATSTASSAAAQSADPEAAGTTTSAQATPAAATPATATPATATPAAETDAASGVAPAANGKTSTPAEPAADPSGRILAALGRGHTAVVLFTTRTAADDRAVRTAVGRVDRRGGKVDVHVVPLSRVGRYEAITRGVTVEQSPTVLVIGKERTARTIVGFTTTAEVDQLVADVRAGR